MTSRGTPTFLTGGVDQAMPTIQDQTNYLYIALGGCAETLLTPPLPSLRIVLSSVRIKTSGNKNINLTRPSALRGVVVEEKELLLLS